MSQVRKSRSSWSTKSTGKTQSTREQEDQGPRKDLEYKEYWNDVKYRGMGRPETQERLGVQERRKVRGIPGAQERPAVQRVLERREARGDGKTGRPGAQERLGVQERREVRKREVRST